MVLSSLKAMVGGILMRRSLCGPMLWWVGSCYLLGCVHVGVTIEYVWFVTPLARIQGPKMEGTSQVSFVL